VQSAGIFRQAAIADLAIAKDQLDVPERMLDFSSGAGFELFGSQFTFAQLLPGAPMCQRSCRLNISEDNYAPLFTGT
jgi:hypothetical protein